MFLVLMAVFSFVFASDPQYKLDLIIGLFLWDFFQEGTKTGLLSLRAKGYLLTKARFPSWILVVTSASNAVITLALFSARADRVPRRATGTPAVTRRGAALYVLYQLLFLAIVAGFSLAASVLFMRYRDLNQVWDVVTQAGFFVAPIIYPLSILPERLHLFLYLWPPTPIILFSRSVLVDDQRALGPRARLAGARSRRYPADGRARLSRSRAARRGVRCDGGRCIEVAGVSKSFTHSERAPRHRARARARLLPAAPAGAAARARGGQLRASARRDGSGSWGATARGKSTLLKIVCRHLPA